MTANRELKAEQLNVSLKTFMVVGKPCQQTDDLDSHFPEMNRIGGGKDWKAKYQEKINIAKAMCARCDVVERCLQFALDNEIQYGIWGGTTPEERQKIDGKVSKGGTK